VAARFIKWAGGIIGMPFSLEGFAFLPTLQTEQEPLLHRMRTSRERLQTWIALSFLSCQQRNDSKEPTGTKPPSAGCQANEPRSRC